MGRWGAIASAALVLVICGRAPADTIRLKDGRVLHGAVEKAEDGSYVVRMAYGTIRFAADEVASVEKDAAEEEAREDEAPAAQPQAKQERRRRVPDLEKLSGKLVEETRAAEAAAQDLAIATNRLIDAINALADTGDSLAMRKMAGEVRREAKRLTSAVDDVRAAARRIDLASGRAGEGPGREAAQGDLARAFEHLMLAAQVIDAVAAVNQRIIDAADRYLRSPDASSFTRDLSWTRLECVRVAGSFGTAREDFQKIADSIRRTSENLGAVAVGSGLAPGQRRGQSVGSGFFVGDGHVLTNAHVVAGAAEVEVEVGGAGCTGRVIARDEALDLALVRVEGATGSPLRFAPHGGQPGSAVFAYGYGVVGSENVLLLVTRGTVSARDTAAKQLVFDAKVNPGNSGGPLVDGDGRWVGVVVAKSRASERQAVESLGFAVEGGAAAAWVRSCGVEVLESVGPAAGSVPPDAMLRAATVRITAGR